MSCRHARGYDRVMVGAYWIVSVATLWPPIPHTATYVSQNNVCLAPPAEGISIVKRSLTRCPLSRSRSACSLPWREF